MHPSIPKFIILGIALTAMVGCRSGTFIHYTSPEVTGRVLAADTREPLANVSVQRGRSQRGFGSFGRPKGAQLLMESRPARTDADGRFVLDSSSVIAMLQRSGWSSVAVTFSHPGYYSFRTNCAGINVSSHAAHGAPVVNVGDILLQPRGR